MRKREARSQRPGARRRKAAKRPEGRKPKPKAKGNKKKAESRTQKAAPKPDRLDLSKFPAESITQMERGICLACVWEVFTRHLKLAPKTALGEIRRYTPSLDELNAASVARPYVAAQSYKEPCPYCRSTGSKAAKQPMFCGVSW
jgi:hypothetical protein